MNPLITLKAYNRPMYLYQTLSALGRCRGINNYRLLISVDKIDGNMSAQMLQAMKLSKIEEHMDDVKAWFSHSKLGCVGNIKRCLEKSFDNDEAFTIHMEDDTVPSESFLEYYKKAAEIMSNRKDIFAACGGNRPCHITGEENWDRNSLVEKFFFDGGYSFCMTREVYKDRIERFGGVKGIEYISTKGRKSNCVGQEWLKETKEGLLSSVWYMHKVSSVIEENGHIKKMNSLFPVENVCKNIGVVGLHSNKELHEEITKNSFTDKHIKYNDNIIVDNRNFVEYGFD